MDHEPEILSDTATNCNRASASETLSDCTQLKFDTLEKKAVHLRLILEKDFKAADMKWSLFVAAAFSFRYDSCLRPFPPFFLKDGIKDMDELLSLITDVPALDLVLQQLEDLDYLDNISDIINLLFYVLVRLKDSNLKTIPPETHDAIFVNTDTIPPPNKPQYIFQIAPSPKSKAETKWKELSKNYRTFYAFYGSRLEHFYTILNFGFKKHLNKVTAMGSGVYFSPDLSISLPFNHGGFGWGASTIGGHLSCIAMCEIIDAPEGINYQRPTANEDDKNGGGETMDPRTTHYFVTNGELIRVRYLLVYAKQPTSIRFPLANNSRDGGAVQQWFGRHKLVSILLGYGLMLATIGLANNQPIQYYYKVLLKKIDMAMNSIKT